MFILLPTVLSPLFVKLALQKQAREQQTAQEAEDRGKTPPPPSVRASDSDKAGESEPQVDQAGQKASPNNTSPTTGRDATPTQRNKNIRSKRRQASRKKEREMNIGLPEQSNNSREREMNANGAGRQADSGVKGNPHSEKKCGGGDCKASAGSPMEENSKGTQGQDEPLDGPQRKRRRRRGRGGPEKTQKVALGQGTQRRESVPAQQHETSSSPLPSALASSNCAASTLKDKNGTNKARRGRGGRRARRFQPVVESRD